MRNVPLSWDETRNLPVIYDRTLCNGETPPVAACAFLFRFADLGGVPIGGVTLQEEKPFRVSREGDEYGRILVRVVADREFSGVASASGYKATEVKIRCVPGNRRLERIVSLEKQKQVVPARKSTP